MKNLRRAKIEEIIEQQRINTQEDLTAALRQEGFEVTQATVSRDIKDMMLLKVPAIDGGYRYVLPPEKNIVFLQSRMRTFQDSVLSIHYSGSMIVFRVLPGTAKAVAVMIDYLDWPEILGSVAGNDTVFVTVKCLEVAEQVVARLHELL